MEHRIIFWKKMRVACLLIAFAAGADATVITWSSAAFKNEGELQGKTGTGRFKRSGTLIYAENCGGTALRFDGIDFAAGVIDFGKTFSGYLSPDGMVLLRIQKVAVWTW